MEVGRVGITLRDRQSVGGSYMLKILLGSVKQLALASLNCTLKYRWREGVRKKKDLEWEKVMMFVGHKETVSTSAVDFFLAFLQRNRFHSHGNRECD